MTYKLSLVYLLAHIAFQYTTAVNFDRDLITLTFNPFLQKVYQNGSIQTSKPFTMQDITSMLRDVSTNFSDVTHSFAYSKSVTDPSKDKLFFDIRTAEAAALLNKETNTTSLTVTLGVFPLDGLTTEEIRIALLSVKKANAIYPGTVKRILLTRPSYTVESANTTLQWIMMARHQSARLNMTIQFGNVQNCYYFTDVHDNIERLKITETIIQETDFIYCSFQMSSNVTGANYSLDRIWNILLYFRDQLKEVNKNIQVGGYAWWLSEGMKPWMTSKDLEEYWIAVNNFASNNSFPIVLKDAFQWPLPRENRRDPANLGWWRLFQSGQLRNVLENVKRASGIEFNREYFTVNLCAYVKKKDWTNEIPSAKSYTMLNVKTMFEVISSKFSKVVHSYSYNNKDPLASGVLDSDNERFYRSRTAEAAAMLNREKNVTLITVTVGIYQLQRTVNATKEAVLALRAAKRANSIHPGTVQKIMLTNTPYDASAASYALELIEIARNLSNSQELSLEIGALLNCLYFFQLPADDFMLKVLMEIANKTDFVYCHFFPADHIAAIIGAKNSFNLISNNLILFRNKLKSINMNVQIGGYSRWSSSHNKFWKTERNIKEYWVAINKFLSQHSFPVILEYAFDCPLLGGSDNADDAHLGWWKLRQNSEINYVAGYVEKAST